MTSRSQELERFKREIDLRQFAANHGYTVDHKASSASGTVMRGTDGTKIRITRGTDGHYVYWNAHDEADSGSIIDFLQNRKGANLGQARQQLRPWIGAAGTQSPTPTRIIKEHLPELVPIERDLAQVQSQIDGMEELPGGLHAYLNHERGLPAELLADPRFTGSIRVDQRRNAAFIHTNQDGACGFELKNREFTGFSKGGAKGLWVSGCRKDDRALVFAEAAIDCLSYAALRGHAGTRFMSISGQPSPEQMELARLAIQKMPPGEVVLAFDNDEAGDQLTERFTDLFSDCQRADCTLRVVRAASRGWDWSDALRMEQNRPEPPSPT